jgi:predicted PurR-regulated permease PerM
MSPVRRGGGTSKPVRWNLRRRVAASFALLIVLLAGLGVVTSVSLLRFADRGQELIDRWQPAVLTSQDLLADLLNEETSVRVSSSLTAASSCSRSRISVRRRPATCCG